VATASPAHGETAGLHSEIQHFLARQMRLLDAGDTDAWAETFTEDGVFAVNALPEPARGRETIRQTAARLHAQRVEEKVQVRHWLGMLDVTPEEDGTVRARAYALLIRTPLGGQAAVEVSTTCEDVLVRGADGGWLVRSRQIRRDDLA
jgi:uncharacterized protein (TIGR02246 family)